MAREGFTFTDPTEPEILEDLRQIHFWLSGYLEGRQPERYEGLDPSHLDALDCTIQWLDEMADRKGDPTNDD